MPEHNLLYFGPFRLDVRNEQLWRGQEGIRLTYKSLAVLRYLVEHGGQLVTKDDLFTAVWPEVVVSDSALVVCIRELRQALGDERRTPQFIETVHGRGYRFVAPLTTTLPPSLESNGQSLESSVQGLESNGQSLESSVQGLESEERTDQTPNPRLNDARLNDPRPQPRRVRSAHQIAAGLMLLAALLLVVHYWPSSSPNPQPLPPNPQSLPLPDKPSIIILPFTNLSGDPGQEYFSDGLTEVLTTDLAKIASLFVIARNSAFTYKGKATRVQDIGREMGVRYVLEGGVLRTDNQVRITTQLIDATTGYHLWSERFDRPFSAIFAVQDEIVQKIVTTLELQLSLMARGYRVPKRTNNPDAYDAVLRGMAALDRDTKEAITVQARQMFEQAIALDPQYAEAYAVLGGTYYLEWALRYSVDPQTLERMVVLVQQALALDDSLPLAHSLLGMAYAQKQQYGQAAAEGERAITLNPNDADSYMRYAHILIWAGRSEDTIKLMVQAMRLNPRYPSIYLFQLGWAYFFTGRYAEAITTIEEFLRRSPNNLAGYLTLASSYVQQWTSQLSTDPQTLEQALAAVRHALALNNTDPMSHMFLGFVYLFQKQYESAITEMEQAITLNPELADSYALLAYTLGCVGRLEDAVTRAEEALRYSPQVVEQHLGPVGAAYYLAGRPEEALPLLRRFLSRYPNFLGLRLILAAVYSELGKETEARAEAAEVLRLNPSFSLDVLKEHSPIKDPGLLERHIAALRKAGLK